MAVDINEELKKSANKTSVYKSYKEYKKQYDDLKKKAGSSQETANDLLSDQLSNFTKKRKKHTANGKTFLDELITQLKELKGAGIESDKLVKRIFVNSLKTLKPQIKPLLIDSVKKALSCDGVQLYTFNQTVYVPVKSVDLLGSLELAIDDRIGKLYYEQKPIVYNKYPFSMNRELYTRTQNLNQPYSAVSGNNYDGTSLQNLFDITYVESYTDPITLQPIQGSFFKVDLKPRQNLPVVDEFLNDYYSTVDIIDYKAFFTNLSDYVTGAISFGKGDGNLKLVSLQKSLLVMQRILGLCYDSNKEIDVSGVSKLSENDNIDNSFFEFTDLDLRIIEQKTSDIKRGVIEFQDCDMVKEPLNVEALLTALDGLNFNEDTSDINEINDALGIIYPAVDDTFKLSIDSGFFEQFVKAIINTILSPKTVLPIMVVAELLNQPFSKLVSNMEDFAKLFRSFFVEFVSKIGAIFTKEVFNELKKEVKALVALLLGDISAEKIKKKYQMILSIVGIVPALTKTVKDFRECKSILDELLQLLNLGVKKKLNKLAENGGDLPLPLLLSAKLLDGYSPTRSFLNTINNLQEIGVPTGPMPDGSPNKFIASIKAMIDGNDQEISENGKVAIGIGPLTITPAGITIPKDAYGKFI
jgi:hypothetical protein